ncbi:radical SAM family heme chaperone HemW [Lachnospiraceae bacterium 46-15]
MINKLELYIHIPFCVRKCAYCDFLSFPAGEKDRQSYVDALLDEIYGAKEKGDAATIFFGGGTPSILPGKEIVRIMDAVRAEYNVPEDAEITLEANPGTLDREKLEAWKRAGINRLSIGLQSAENAELKALGRIHTWETFLESYQMAREAGFQNINIDLMSALPGQTAYTWRETLQKVTALEPEHISAYSLIVEEGTPFYEKYAGDVRRRDKGLPCEFLPSEDEERQMYYDTGNILEAGGYRRYEISNYAREGFECRHNCGYWERENYRGFGLGASSLVDEVRFHNTKNMEKYRNRVFDREDEECLGIEAQMEEFMFLGLRLMRGISVKGFEEKFHISYASIYGKISRELEEKKLLRRENGRIFLTERGIDISNYVLSEFLLSE